MVEQESFTIILDLDETLVHSFMAINTSSQLFDYLCMMHTQELQRCRSKQLTWFDRRYFFFAGPTHRWEDIVVILRPGVRQFLQRLSQLHHIAIWSAGERDYVDKIVKLLFKHNELKNLSIEPRFVMYRSDLCFYKDGLRQINYHKSIRKIRDTYHHLSIHIPANHLVLFDNRKENAICYPDHFVLVPDYKRDRLLMNSPETLVKYMNADRYLIDSAVNEIKAKFAGLRELRDEPEPLFLPENCISRVSHQNPINTS